MNREKEFSEIAFSVYVDRYSELYANRAKEMADCLGILRRRFSCSIVFTCSDVRADHFPIFTGWLEGDLIERIVCSNSERYVFDDAVNGVLSAKARTIIFVDAKYLVEHFSAVLKFTVCSLHASEGARLDVSGEIASVDLEALKLSRRDHFTGNSGKLLELIRRCGGLVSPSIGGEEVEPPSPAHQLFLTDAGLRRLSVDRAFSAAPVTFGGVRVADHTRVMVVHAQGAGEGAFGRHFPQADVESIGAYFSGKEKSVVYDIAPAASIPDNTESALSLPRFVLVGRKVGFDLRVRGGYQAVLIASNYNKSKYIAPMLYGAMMQLYPNVVVDFVDDGSSDDSLIIVETFKAAFGLSDSAISVRRNQCNLGTYWIRNDVILRNQSEECVFFVNDSDDCSTAFRVQLQLSMLERSEGYGNFLDIVRVNENYVTAPLNGEVERYGTASLCFTRKLIDRVGYFQVVKKNADTEFIERTRRFVAKGALPWVRYAGLIQPFDGTNLTNDMYERISDNAFSARMSDARAAYTEMFRSHHERISGEDVSRYYQFPRSTVPDEFSSLGLDFLVPGYEGADRYVVYAEKRPKNAELDCWFDLDLSACYIDDDGGIVFLLNRDERMKLHMSFTSALNMYARMIARRFHLISRSAFSGFVGSDKIGSIIRDLIQRSKWSGDNRVICRDGSMMMVSEALSRWPEDWVESTHQQILLVPYLFQGDDISSIVTEESRRRGALS